MNRKIFQFAISTSSLLRTFSSARVQAIVYSKGWHTLTFGYEWLYNVIKSLWSTNTNVNLKWEDSVSDWIFLVVIFIAEGHINHDNTPSWSWAGIFMASNICSVFIYFPLLYLYHTAKAKLCMHLLLVVIVKSSKYD